MPATLTHASILLLARRRLRRLHRDLAAKRALRTNPVSDLELRVAHLARKADAMLSTPPWAEPEGGDPLAGGISKFALLGCMGPDVPAFAALLAPGQAWIFDTVHKGTPDSHREAVQAGTTDLALEIWSRAAALAAAQVTDAASRERTLAQVRAYVLGHLAHLAGDVVAHPWVNSVEWRGGDPVFEHHEVEGSLDARVARQVLGRAGTREGGSWDDWWPAADDVPPQLPAAWAEALERVYHLSTNRPKGFAEYEAKHEKRSPPPLSSELMRDGFDVFGTGVIGIAYGWGWRRWFGVLSLLALPLLALPPLALSAPRARRHFSEAGPGEDSEEAWSDLLTLPLAALSLPTLAVASIAAGITIEGVERYAVTGLVASGLTAVLGLIALDRALGDTPPAPPLRWLMLFLPVAAGLVHLVQLDRSHIGKLPLVHALPLGALTAFFVFFLISQAFSGGDPERGVLLGLWTAVILVGWIWGAKKLRDARIPEEPESLTDRPHHVRLFDDSTLFHVPAVEEPGPADRFYPSGRRKLLELWAGAGQDLWVRSDGFQLVFSTDGTTANLQTVRAPIEPLTAAEYVQLLEASVPGLKAKVPAPDDDYVLPPGFTFAAEPGQLARLGPVHEPTPIFHAPKAAQAVRFGVRGPVAAHGHVPSPLGDADGFRFVHDPLDAGDGGTVMDLAADFAALLLLGGASRMLPAAERAVPDTTPVGAIQQVFRNWNLDRRRVDEWRTLVAGRALGDPGAAPVPGPLAEGEATARAMGWVPLLRTWHAAARQPGVDVIEDRALDPAAPTLRALSRGLAWLLDMNDPVKVP